MKLVKQYPILGSSVNPEKLGLTVKGFIVALIPLAVLVAEQFGINLTQSELIEALNYGVSAVSTLMVLYGALRKIVVKIRG